MATSDWFIRTNRPTRIRQIRADRQTEGHQRNQDRWLLFTSHKKKGCFKVLVLVWERRKNWPRRNSSGQKIKIQKGLDPDIQWLAKESPPLARRFVISSIEFLRRWCINCTYHFACEAHSPFCNILYKSSTSKSLHNRFVQWGKNKIKFD